MRSPKSGGPGRREGRDQVQSSEKRKIRNQRELAEEEDEYRESLAQDNDQSSEESGQDSQRASNIDPNTNVFTNNDRE